MKDTKPTIGVIGAGAWGTALANAYAMHGFDVTMWSRNEYVREDIEKTRENKRYLPGHTLSEQLKVTGSLGNVSACEIILVVTPAQHTRNILKTLKADIRAEQTLVLCSKGIEIESGSTMTDLVNSEIGNHERTAVMVGPTFAKDLIEGKPMAATLGVADKAVGKELQDRLSLRSLRLYVMEDIGSVQIGGAIKNVIAIAAGVISQMNLGESAQAALITRGLAEMARLAYAMGGKRETLLGMCGVGDLILTCNSTKSRNYTLGILLGQGKSMEEIMSERVTVTEGVATAKALEKLAQEHAVDMPITEAVRALVNGEMSAEEAVESMLDRSPKQETV